MGASRHLGRDVRSRLRAHVGRQRIDQEASGSVDDTPRLQIGDVLTNSVAGFPAFLREPGPHCRAISHVGELKVTIHRRLSIPRPRDDAGRYSRVIWDMSLAEAVIRPAPAREVEAKTPRGAEWEQPHERPECPRQ